MVGGSAEVVSPGSCRPATVAWIPHETCDGDDLEARTVGAGAPFPEVSVGRAVRREFKWVLGSIGGRLPAWWFVG